MHYFGFSIILHRSIEWWERYLITLTLIDKLRAEDDPVVGAARAGDGARGVVLRVAVRVRAQALEVSAH